jgi:hypothetical protein
MSTTELPHPLSRKDAAALIGILAAFSGEIMLGQFKDEQLAPIRDRMTRDNLLPLEASQEEMLQSLADLIQRIRAALGEYDSPPFTDHVI